MTAGVELKRADELLLGRVEADAYLRISVGPFVGQGARLCLWLVAGPSLTAEDPYSSSKRELAGSDGDPVLVEAAADDGNCSIDP